MIFRTERQSLIRWSAVVLSLCLNPVLAATESDRESINIQADRAMVSELDGLSVYSGHVVITQGSMKILADEVRLKSENNRLTSILAVGDAAQNGLAGFTRGATRDLESITASASEVEYLVASQQLTLRGQAVLSLGQDRYQGNLLSYDIAKGIFKLESGQDPSDRVNLTINPKADQPL